MRPLLFVICDRFVLGIGEEFGQGSSFTAGVMLHGTDLHQTERFGQPARAIEQPLGFASHIAFLEVVDELYRWLALRLAHGFENTRLGDPAEIVVGGRLPAHCCHVESDGAGEDVGVIEPLPDAVGGDPAVIVAVGRLIKRIDRGRCAMREQRSLLFPIKRGEDPPEVTFVLGKAGLPPIVPGVDGFRRCALLQAGRRSGKRRCPDRYFQTTARRGEAIECRQHKIVQHGLEGDGRVVCQRIAQRQRAMCGQLGDQPIRQRLDRVVVLLLDGFGWRAANGDNRTFDSGIGIWSVVGLSVALCFVLGLDDAGASSSGRA